MRDVPDCLEVADFVLELKDLVKLNLGHFSDLGRYFKVGSLVLSPRRVGEHVIQLHHRFFKCFQFQVLRLDHYEELV